MGFRENVLTGSINIFHMSSGSCNNCDIEILDSLTPRFDIERFGITLVGSVKHADVMLCTGSANRLTVPIIKNLYEQMPKPGFVIVYGACGCSRGIFKDSYNTLAPLDEIIPVDAYIPGCPPKPEATIAAIVKLIDKIRARKAKRI